MDNLLSVDVCDAVNDKLKGTAIAAPTATRTSKPASTCIAIDLPNPSSIITIFIAHTHLRDTIYNLRRTR